MIQLYFNIAYYLIHTHIQYSKHQQTIISNQVCRRTTPKLRREISDGDINPRRAVAVSLGDIFGVACDGDDDHDSNNDSLLMSDSARALPRDLLAENSKAGVSNKNGAQGAVYSRTNSRGEGEGGGGVDNEYDDSLNELRYPATDSDDDYETDLENER